MSDIFVKKINEGIVQILCEKHLAMEIHENFKFLVDNYKFMPAYKNGFWDGNIRLFDINRRTLPIGLVPKLLEKFPEYDIDIDDSLIPKGNCNEKIVEKYAEKQNIHDEEGNKIIPYDFQLSAINHILNNEKVLLLSPTSSGKSLIIYLTLRMLMESKVIKKALVLTPRVSLVTQLFDNFGEYSVKNGWNVKENCHMIYTGQEKTNKNPVTISTWQSLMNLSAKFFKGFDCIIVDEAHEAEGTEIQKIMQKCSNAKYRIGATGTLKDAKANQLVLEGYFGPVFRNIKTKEMIDRDLAPNLKINCLELKYPDKDRKPKRDFRSEKDFLYEHESRLDFLINLINSRKGNSLILIDKIDYGKKLLEKLDSSQAFLIKDDTPVEERKRIIKLARERNDLKIISTYQLFSTGINIKNLHNIITANSLKSKVKILQSIGRLLRKMKGKTLVNLYDVIDNLKWKSRDNYAIKHFRERLKTYDNENFNYTLKKVILKEHSRD